MKKAELEEALRKADEQNSAYYEWFRSVNAGHAEASLDVEIEGRVAMRVLVRGVQRACGGVAVIHSIDMDYFERPVFLSSLISKWLHDGTREIRRAAESLHHYMLKAHELRASGEPEVTAAETIEYLP